MTKDRPRRFVLVLRPLPGRDAIRELRCLLKFALQGCGLKCTDLRELRDEDAA